MSLSSSPLFLFGSDKEDMALADTTFLTRSFHLASSFFFSCSTLNLNCLPINLPEQPCQFEQVATNLIIKIHEKTKGMRGYWKRHVTTHPTKKWDPKCRRKMEGYMDFRTHFYDIFLGMGQKWAKPKSFLMTNKTFHSHICPMILWSFLDWPWPILRGLA